MISVCMATHNGAKYIRKQLDSILPQLSLNDEIVISDDGSSDETIAIVSSYQDSRIRIYNYVHPMPIPCTSIRVTMNFQNAFNHAGGNYIFICDQDDEWACNKIEVCLDALKNSDLVVHNFELCDENLNSFRKTGYQTKYPFRDFLKLRHSYFGCTMAFRREVMSYVLPFPEKLELYDFWIGILVELKGKVAFIDEPLIKYRVRGGSVSHAVSNTIFHKIKYRLYILRNIVIRFSES